MSSYAKRSIIGCEKDEARLSFCKSSIVTMRVTGESRCWLLTNSTTVELLLAKSIVTG